MGNTAQKVDVLDREKLIQEATIVKRNGSPAPFDQFRIYRAIEHAFRADFDRLGERPAETELADELRRITMDVVAEVLDAAAQGGPVDVEFVQDVVERKLMQYGHYSVAKRYILYREEHAKARHLRTGEQQPKLQTQLHYIKADGNTAAIEWGKITQTVESACDSLPGVSPRKILEQVARSLFNRITEPEIERAIILAARSLIEQEPAYSHVSARLLLNVICREVFGQERSPLTYKKLCRDGFRKALQEGIQHELLDERLLEFDIEHLAVALAPERDHLFQYLGLQTIYDRYLLHIDKRRFETPQYFWMRVAMGLALQEDNKEQRAIEFYEILSTMRFVSSTPTLFNAGTRHPQLSSCYLSTVKDDLFHIFKVVQDNAMLSKWAGGIGNDWTSVRATGARIKGTNGESQGVVPFLKVVNDTAIAVNQGGKRKGAICAYLETWHLEIEEFLELRKNTGDERRRTHDMHTANWIPDLFMKRVRSNGVWTLFSPNEAPDLHDLYGKAFEQRYEAYERLAQEGGIKQFKQLPAAELWRKMLSMLFETGHPWITFKDPANIRSPQDHAGVVHNSNLCTEILLNTSEKETAVCNLGSVNLANHTTESGIDTTLLASTISTAVRMLDNVIDINYYPTEEAGNANLQHRPIGLGIMGFQDALYVQGVAYASPAAVQFADTSAELISYHAILASSRLAEARGRYKSYAGSKWDRGLLPIDTLALLEAEREGMLQVDRSSQLDWSVVRESVRAHGMRNSNVMAIAPTATIANICGVSQSIEPTFRHLYVKSNLSGEFTVVNPYLVEELKRLSLWDAEMVDDLKYYDGLLGEIDRIPADVKEIYKTAIEIEPKWLIECAARRQKWIDMSQSLNLYINTPSGKLLSEMYMYAWEKGLKTTYYLRSVGATSVEKSSIDVNRRGIQPRWMKNKSASSNIAVTREESKNLCAIDDPDCEACQ